MRKEFKDYYKILGVPKSATAEDIKKAFRQLAVQYHPDRNAGEPLCEEKFKGITEAYGVLIDPAKRRKYDLFKTTRGTGTEGDHSGFRYTQDDIFKETFNNPRYRKIFEELNREFSQSGFRSGPGFFQNTFFNGGSSGFWKLLWLLPGPLGRIGNLLRLFQVLGSAIFFLARIINPRPETGRHENTNPFIKRFRNVFKKLESAEPPETQNNIQFSIKISPSDANAGTQKNITYKVNEIPERLVVKIPPGTCSGQTLRVKQKGKRQGNKRGDLLLKIQVESGEGLF